MASVSDAITKIVREDISPGVDDALVELDPVFKELHNTSMGVVRNEGIGRSWKVIKTLLTSLAGSYRATGRVDGDEVYSTSTPYVVHKAPTEFDGVAGFVSPGYVMKEFQLQEHIGTIVMPQELIRADQLTASIASAVAAIIKQTARMIALVRANEFFSSDATNKTIAVVAGSNGVVSGGTNGDKNVTLALSPSSRIRNLSPGMKVDLWSSNGSDLRNSVDGTESTRFDLVVYSVDPIEDSNGLYRVRLDSADGTSAFATGHLPANGDLIVLSKSKGKGVAGLEDWIKTAGTLYGNLDLAVYPQFKSVVKNVNGSLSDDVLRKYLAGFIMGHGAAMAPDTLLTTEGVLNDYVDNFDTDRQWHVQGTAQRIVGGYDDGIKFVLNGRVFNFRISSQVPGGYLYALKLRDKNIKRYLPPRLPNSGTRGEFDNIEFIAPLGGSRDIWKHAHGPNGGSTKYLEAPFVSIEEIVPDVIPAVKLTGLTEDIETA